METHIGRYCYVERPISYLLLQREGCDGELMSSNDLLYETVLELFEEGLKV